MTFQITVLGSDHDELTDRGKERLAVHIHEILQENYDVQPDSVDIDGYRE